MKLIAEIFGRVVGFEFALLHIKISGGGDDEPGEMIGHDPHSTLSSQVERGPGAGDGYSSDVVGGKPKFGFAHVTDQWAAGVERHGCEG